MDLVDKYLGEGKVDVYEKHKWVKTVIEVAKKYPNVDIKQTSYSGLTVTGSMGKEIADFIKDVKKKVNIPTKKLNNFHYTIGLD